MDSITDFPDASMPVPDLTSLAALLCVREYTALARGTILAYAGTTGTLEGCPYLEPEDRPDADRLLEAAWPAEAWTSPGWDEDIWRGRPARWRPAGAAPRSHDGSIEPEPDAEPVTVAGLVPPELELTEDELLEAWDREAEGLEAGRPAPTAEDLSDYAAWSERLDAEFGPDAGAA